MANVIGSSSYRIGPSDFFTSGDLQADGATLNGQVNRLDDADLSKPSAEWFDAWNAFVVQWRAFYKSLGFFSAINDSNRDQLIQFEHRFNDLASQYQDATGDTIPDIVNVSTGTKDTLGDQVLNQLQPLAPALHSAYIALAIGAVVVVIGYFLFRRWAR
jgi:hypothetical protein